jgi:hypothetical protein
MRLLMTQEGLPRVSWGAVIAGVILSLIVYLILTVLGQPSARRYSPLCLSEIRLRDSALAQGYG